MLNKILKNNLIALLSGTLVSVGAMAAANPSFNGFYGGVMGGVAQTNTNMSNATSVTYTNYYDADNNITSSQKADTYNYSGVAALYLGYGQFINNSNVYLAAEIFGDMGRHSSTLNTSTFHAQPNDDEDSELLTTTDKASLKNGEFGIDIRPGYLLDTNTLVYGRVGLAFNKLTLDSSGNFNFSTTQATPTVVYNSPLSTTTSKNVTGLRLGVGLEHRIGDKLAITADYIYTYYGKINNTGTADAIGIDPDSIDVVKRITPNGFVDNASARMSTQSVWLGFKYYFS